MKKKMISIEERRKQDILTRDLTIKDGSGKRVTVQVSGDAFVASSPGALFEISLKDLNEIYEGNHRFLQLCEDSRSYE